MSLRAVIYARVSTEDQKRKGARDPVEGSCETQFRNCRELAAKLGAQVVREFKDEGITGDASDRPDYVVMLAAAVRGEFDLIVSNEVSRLWRNKAETWRCVEDLQHRGIRIVTRDGYDSTNAATEYLLAFISVSSCGRHSQGIDPHLRRANEEGTRRAAGGWLPLRLPAPQSDGPPGPARQRCGAGDAPRDPPRAGRHRSAHLHGVCPGAEHVRHSACAERRPSAFARLHLGTHCAPLLGVDG